MNPIPDSLSPTKEAVLNLLRVGLGFEASVPLSYDWADVYDVASRQGVSAIVFDGYASIYSSGVLLPEMSKNDRRTWLSDTIGQETRAMAQFKAASDLAGLFAKNNIITYVLKGFVVSECYPNPLHRCAVDFDCFLMPYSGYDFNAYEVGNALMEKNGIRVSRDKYKHSQAKVSNLNVENHCFLTPFRGDKTLKQLEIYLQNLLKENNGDDKIEGTELSRPSVMFSVLFLLEHSYSHFLLEGVTLRHVTDWAMFCRRHKAEIDWEAFERQIDGFGFRRFYDAWCHVGEYVLGEREYSSLSDPEKIMMDAVWDGPFSNGSSKGFWLRINNARNILRSNWRYRLFSSHSMLQAFWIKTKGVLFIRHPSI